MHGLVVNSFLARREKACMAVSLPRMVAPSDRFCKVINCGSGVLGRGLEFPQVKMGT